MLVIFYELLKGKELSVNEVVKKYGVSRTHVYTFFNDINLFIAEFYLFGELELCNNKKNGF